MPIRPMPRGNRGAHLLPSAEPAPLVRALAAGADLAPALGRTVALVGALGLIVLGLGTLDAGLVGDGRQAGRAELAGSSGPGPIDGAAEATALGWTVGALDEATFAAVAPGMAPAPALLELTGSGAAEADEPAPIADGAPTTTAAPAPVDTTAPAGGLPAVTAPDGGGDAATVRAPAPRPDREALLDLIRAGFGPLADAAIEVARCESGLDPRAVSPGRGNWGLFQINVVHRDLVASMGHAWEDLLDPAVNVEVAVAVHREAGDWSPWACAWAAR